MSGAEAGHRGAARAVPPFGLRFLRRLPEPRAARAGAQGHPYVTAFKKNVKLTRAGAREQAGYRTTGTQASRWSNGGSPASTCVTSSKPPSSSKT